MPSMTRVKIGSSVAVLFGVLLLAYLFLGKGCLGSSSNFHLVPDSNLMIVEIRQPASQLEKLASTDWWKDIQEVQFVHKLPKLLDAMNTTFGDSSQLKPVHQTAHLLASLHLSNAKDYDYLGILKGIGSVSYLLDKANQKGINYEDHVYNGVRIYELKTSPRPLHISSVGACIIFSFQSTLLEEAILAYNNAGSNSVARKARKAFSAFQKNSVHVYVNSEKATYFESAYLRNGTNSLFDEIARTSDGFAFDLDIENTALGFDIKSDGVKSAELGNLFKVEREGYSKTPGRIAELVPHNSAAFLYQEVSDGSSFLKSLAGNDKNYQQFFEEWMGNHWGLVFTEQVNANESIPACIILSCKSAARAQHLMSLLSKQQMGQENFIDYRGIDLMPLPEPWVIEKLYGKWIAGLFKGNYVAVVGDHVVIANDKRPLEQLINHKESGQVLSALADYQELSGALDQQNQHLFVQPRFLQQTFRDHASKGMRNWFEKSGHTFDKARSAIVYPNKKNRVAHLSARLKFGSSRRASSSVVWSTVLEAPALFAPQVVKGPDGFPYLFVQDKNFKLYQLSKDGKIAWSKKLDGPLLGKIYQLDYYQIGKVNFTFNTEQKIYVVGKDGGNVSNFPIRLSAEASAGMLMIDKARNETEKVFIPSLNKKVYGYMYSGQPLSGWNPKEGLGPVTQSLRYFRQKDREYIISCNDDGIVHFLNRSGNLQFLVNLGSPIVGSIQFDQREGLGVLVVSTEDGKTHVINQEGAFWSKKYMGEDQLNAFITGNFSGDRNQELAFSSTQRIGLATPTDLIMEVPIPCSDGILFTASLEKSPISSLACYCAGAQEIHAFNEKLEAVVGFPLAASTEATICDLFENNEAILVAGGLQRNVFAYRLP